MHHAHAGLVVEPVLEDEWAGQQLGTHPVLQRREQAAIEENTRRDESDQEDQKHEAQKRAL